MTERPGADASGPLLPTLRDDPQADRVLRDSLRVIRDRVDDAALRRRIEEVLSGRGSLRDLARSGEFAAFIGPYADEGRRTWDAQRRDDQPSRPS